MAELSAEAPWAGLDLPLAVGDARLEGCALPGLLSVAPFRGREAAVVAVLGFDLPEPGRISDGAGLRAVWFGIGQVLVEAPEERLPGLEEALAAEAAVTDQSDAWAGLVLTGTAAGSVLARLVPLDLDLLVPGAVARSQLRHMMAAVMPVEGGYEIRVMRSFAGTAVGEIAGAMRRVAAEAALAYSR